MQRTSAFQSEAVEAWHCSARHDSDPDVAQDVQEVEDFSNDPTDQHKNEKAQTENLDHLQHQLKHNLASLFFKLHSLAFIWDGRTGGNSTTKSACSSLRAPFA